MDREGFGLALRALRRRESAVTLSWGVINRARPWFERETAEISRKGRVAGTQMPHSLLFFYSLETMADAAAAHPVNLTAETCLPWKPNCCPGGRDRTRTCDLADVNRAL